MSATGKSPGEYRTRARRFGRNVYRGTTRIAGSIECVDTSADEFVVTYDDGPDPRYTPGIMQALAEHDATATFFVLLSKVRRAPGLLTEIVAGGHEIGLHGLDHTRLTGLPRREVRDRTAAGRRELEDLLGVPIRWMRPPYGAQTPATWLAVRQAGLMPVVWSGTMWDWKDISHEQRLAKAMSTCDSGVILLGHDSFPGSADGAPNLPEPVVDRPRLARDVLGSYADAGLRGRSLSAALGNGTPRKSGWFAR